MKDSDQYEYEINEWKRKLNMMSEQVKVYEDTIKTRDERILFLEKKIQEAAKDNINVRAIMTKNIIESNSRIQDILKENQDLKSKLSKVG